MQFRAVLLCSALIVLCSLGLAQKTNVVTVPAPHTSATSGKEMYLAYCAACHGREGKGDGPVASQLKVPPGDLTSLAKRNDGRFPSVQVVNVITGRAGVPGSRLQGDAGLGPDIHGHGTPTRVRGSLASGQSRGLRQVVPAEVNSLSSWIVASSESIAMLSPRSRAQPHACIVKS